MRRKHRTVTDEDVTTETMDVPRARTAVVDLSAPVVQTAAVRIQHLNFRVTARQSVALRMLFDGLVAEGARVNLASSEPVERQHDALRWILDRVADQVVT